MNLIIAGIHTGIGKTICSTVLVDALQYDYWKPVQAGDLALSDSHFVAQNIANNKSKIHTEAFSLKIAASPHYAAQLEGKEITLENIKLPFSLNNIIVETAGGILSPLSNKLSNIDLIKHLNIPVILVTNDYLGSINHTMLSIEVLNKHNIKPIGLIFSGNKVSSTREYLLKNTNIKELCSIPQINNISKEAISKIAESMKDNLKNKLHDLSRKG